jgi:pimeloyl-ACP methyl ester carboxylesterase
MGLVAGQGATAAPAPWPRMTGAGWRGRPGCAGPNRRVGCAVGLGLLALMLVAAAGSVHAEDRPGLKPCRLEGVEHGALCGRISRPLDPAQPAGLSIDVHFAVLPALARNRKPDPVFFLAGGPGQSALELAGVINRMMARLGNRRDLVLVDQRGTGQSAPLRCAEQSPAATPLADLLDPARQRQRLAQCLQQLQALPYGDLRHYTTPVAVQDLNAVRQQLSAERVNLVGASYGTRVALEYMRQFPQATRRVVIDGVAPPDMVLPASFSTDSQVALEQVLAACEGESACRLRFPSLRADWGQLLNSLPRSFNVSHPLTGTPEALLLTRDTLLSLVRTPLYAPALAAALPAALHEATQGRLQALVALASALGGGRSRRGQIFEGMHFAVVCSEDVPRLAAATDVPGADFGGGFAQQYQQLCQGWPRAVVPPAFYTLPVANGATLVLSGGADPATPPRHGQRVAQALGPLAQHQVVAQASHGVLSLPCMRDVVFRFIDADRDDLALKVDRSCADRVPRPAAFLPPAAVAHPAAPAPGPGPGHRRAPDLAPQPGIPPLQQRAKQSAQPGAESVSP